MSLARAKAALADRGLRGAVRYRSTTRHPAGTVISQSRRTGAGVLPKSRITPSAVDYDCAGGSGDGPRYVEGPLEVRPPDPFDLDREGDGVGCEAG